MGSEMNGETVRGTWARRGWGSVSVGYVSFFHAMVVGIEKTCVRHASSSSSFVSGCRCVCVCD